MIWRDKSMWSIRKIIQLHVCNIWISERLPIILLHSSLYCNTSENQEGPSDYGLQWFKFSAYFVEMVPLPTPDAVWNRAYQLQITVKEEFNYFVSTLFKDILNQESSLSPLTRLERGECSNRGCYVTSVLFFSLLLLLHEIRFLNKYFSRENMHEDMIVTDWNKRLGSLIQPYNKKSWRYQLS